MKLLIFRFLFRPKCQVQFWAVFCFAWAFVYARLEQISKHGLDRKKCSFCRCSPHCSKDVLGKQFLLLHLIIVLPKLDFKIHAFTNCIIFKKLDHPRPRFRLFFVFFKQTSMQFLQQINVTNFYPLYGAGIRTHNLQIASLIP